MGWQNATSKPKFHSSKTAHRCRQCAIEQEVQVLGVEEANKPVQIRQPMPGFSLEVDMKFDMEEECDNPHNEYGCLDEE